jgi:hypothetical protein
VIDEVVENTTPMFANRVFLKNGDANKSMTNSRSRYSSQDDVNMEEMNQD